MTPCLSRHLRIQHEEVRDDLGLGHVGLEAVGCKNDVLPPISESFARVQNSLNFRANCLASVAIFTSFELSAMTAAAQSEPDQYVNHPDDEEYDRQPLRPRGERPAEHVVKGWNSILHGLYYTASSFPLSNGHWASDRHARLHLASSCFMTHPGNRQIHTVRQ